MIAYQQSCSSYFFPILFVIQNFVRRLKFEFLMFSGARIVGEGDWEAKSIVSAAATTAPTATAATFF